MNPIAVFLKAQWKWIGIGLAVAALAWAVDHYKGKADLAEQRVETVAAEKAAAEERETRLIEERKVLVANQQAWAETAKIVRQLADDTARARATEAAKLTTIAADVAAAKQGIRNAPGASDRFVFSDAAIGVMRARPGAADNAAGGGGASPAQAAPVVGRR